MHKQCLLLSVFEYSLYETRGASYMKLSSGVAIYEFGVVKADEEEVILSGTAVVESSRYTFRKIAHQYVQDRLFCWTNWGHN